MRWFAILAVVAMLALGGCANVHSVAAHQMPAPYPSSVARAAPSSAFYRQTALGSVTGTSRFSWFLPEPNRTVFRARFDRALEMSELAAPNRDHARFVVNFDFSHIDGPDFGAHMDAAMVGRVQVIDRLDGSVVMDEPVSARREASWPGVMESDWADGGVLGVLNIVPFFFDSPWFSVGPRMDTVYPAYSGPEWLPLIPIRMRAVDGQLIKAADGKVYGAASGPTRAWQINAAVSDAIAAAFLKSLGRRGDVDILRVLPCWGGTEIAQMKFDLMRRGKAFTTMPCNTAPREPLATAQLDAWSRQ